MADLVVTCGRCGNRWHYRGHSGRTQCRLCRTRLYVPAATRRQNPGGNSDGSRAVTIRGNGAPSTATLPTVTHAPTEPLQAVEASRGSSRQDVVGVLADVVGRFAASRAPAPRQTVTTPTVRPAPPPVAARGTRVRLSCGHTAEVSGLGTNPTGAQVSCPACGPQQVVALTPVSCPRCGTGVARCRLAGCPMR